jgi:PRTRC genetic system protein C
MSSLKVEALHREFFYNGTRIPDPASNLTVEQVREILTPTYPEIATAILTGPEDTGSALRYTFTRAIGSKG